MNTYKQMYEEAVKDKAVKQLTPEYKKWGKVGEKVIGAFISKGAVESTVNEGSYFQYVFETDQGNVKFHMGKATDNDVGATLVPGIIYCITYLGKEEISSTRRVNKFMVEEIGPMASYASEPIQGSANE